jgi:hypothetical protein
MNPALDSHWLPVDAPIGMFAPSLTWVVIVLRKSSEGGAPPGGSRNDKKCFREAESRQ